MKNRLISVFLAIALIILYTACPQPNTINPNIDQPEIVLPGDQGGQNGGNENGNGGNENGGQQEGNNQNQDQGGSGPEQGETTGGYIFSYDDFETENLGGAGSGYKIYKWEDNKDGSIDEYGKYVKGLAKDLNDSLDDNTKNYFKTYLDTVNQNNYNTDNLNNVIGNNYNKSAYIFEALIKTLPTETERVQLCYSFEALSNEAYAKGGDMTSDMEEGYNEMKRLIIGHLKYCGLTATDWTQDIDEAAGELIDDIDDNHCTQIAAGLNNILEMAANNLNNQKGYNIEVADLQKLINILLATRSMQNEYNKECTVPLTLDSNMEAAINDYTTGMNRNSTMEL